MIIKICNVQKQDQVGHGNILKLSPWVSDTKIQLYNVQELHEINPKRSSNTCISKTCISTLTQDKSKSTYVCAETNCRELPEKLESKNSNFILLFCNPLEYNLCLAIYKMVCRSKNIIIILIMLKKIKNHLGNKSEFLVEMIERKIIR